MKDIKLLVEHIEEELEDACTYAELALEYKNKDQDLAQMFYKLSNDEMTHKDSLHNAVVRIIADYKRTTGEPPVEMAAVYDFMHKRHIEKLEEAHRYQEIYKNL